MEVLSGTRKLEIRRLLVKFYHYESESDIDREFFNPAHDILWDTMLRALEYCYLKKDDEKENEHIKGGIVKYKNWFVQHFGMERVLTALTNAGFTAALNGFQEEGLLGEGFVLVESLLFMLRTAQDAAKEEINNMFIKHIALNDALMEEFEKTALGVSKLGAFYLLLGYDDKLRLLMQKYTVDYLPMLFRPMYTEGYDHVIAEAWRKPVVTKEQLFLEAKASVMLQWYSTQYPFLCGGDALRRSMSEIHMTEGLPGLNPEVKKLFEVITQKIQDCSAFRGIRLIRPFYGDVQEMTPFAVSYYNFLHGMGMEFSEYDQQVLEDLYEENPAHRTERVSKKRSAGGDGEPRFKRRRPSNMEMEGAYGWPLKGTGIDTEEMRKVSGPIMKLPVEQLLGMMGQERRIRTASAEYTGTELRPNEEKLLAAIDMFLSYMNTVKAEYPQVDDVDLWDMAWQKFLPVMYAQHHAEFLLLHDYFMHSKGPSDAKVWTLAEVESVAKVKVEGMLRGRPHGEVNLQVPLILRNAAVSKQLDEFKKACQYMRLLPSEKEPTLGKFGFRNGIKGKGQEENDRKDVNMNGTEAISPRKRAWLAFFGLEQPTSTVVDMILLLTNVVHQGNGPISHGTSIPAYKLHESTMHSEISRVIAEIKDANMSLREARDTLKAFVDTHRIVALYIINLVLRNPGSKLYESYNKIPQGKQASAMVSKAFIDSSYAITSDDLQLAASVVCTLLHADKVKGIHKSLRSRSSDLLSSDRIATSPPSAVHHSSEPLDNESSSNKYMSIDLDGDSS